MHRLTANGKGMEFWGWLGWGGVREVQEHSLILSYSHPFFFFFDPTIPSAEVMFSVLCPRETAKLGRTG